MMRKDDFETAAEIAPLAVTRVFATTRDRVYAAWTSAEQLRRWFCPAEFSIPEARVDPRAGGVFELCMRSSAGDEHWIRGSFRELERNRRLLIDVEVTSGSQPLFRAHTLVELEELPGGSTSMQVVQRYQPLEARALPMIAGAPQGWAQTLERLEGELAADRDRPLAARSVVHSTFRLERRFEAAPARVYAAFTDPAAKSQWFGCGPGLSILSREMEVRPGGRERLRARWPSGLETRFDAVYLDVVNRERLVYAYEMHLDARRISVSLATIEFQPAEAATRLVLTEQGAFLDGYDDAGSRERGTNGLLDALQAWLAGPPA